MQTHNLKVIDDLYSQYLTQNMSKTTSFTNTEGVCLFPSIQMDVVGPLARKSPCVWVQLTNCISQLFLQIHRAAHARGGDDDKLFPSFFGGENTSDSGLMDV